MLWRLAIQVSPGGYQIIGEVESSSFEEACRMLAVADPGLDIRIVGSLATYRGHAVVVLRDDGSLADRPDADT